MNIVYEIGFLIDVNNLFSAPLKLISNSDLYVTFLACQKS